MKNRELNKFRDYVIITEETPPPEEFLKLVKTKAESLSDICDLLINIKDASSPQYKKGVELVYSLINGLNSSKDSFLIDSDKLYANEGAYCQEEIPDWRNTGEMRG